MNIYLQLTENQIQELVAISTQFNHEIEEEASPPFPKAATLSQMKEQLKAVLFEQEGFADIWQKSESGALTLVISHPQTVIRNLPWHLATEERPLLAIAKSFEKELIPHQATAFPLKVLVMVAAPQGVTRLDYEKEELQLLRSFAPLMAQGLAEVHFTDDGSLEDLEEKLGENKFHILHFSGHGIYDKNEKQGYLALEDQLTGEKHLVTAKDFNRVLQKVGRKGHCPDLVLLSACQSAHGKGDGDLSGVADTLLEGGVAAVIAMSASILDSCATIFASKLYAELSDGYPLSAAFQEARLEVKKYELSLDLVKAGLAPAHWLIPQLLFHKVVKELVDKTAPKETINLSNAAKLISGEQALLDLRVRPENYVFVGRRKERRQALQLLKAGKSVLLRGQGGVGKTALAENLAIRLLAKQPGMKVFTFSEKTPDAQSLLDQMKTYLSKEHQYMSIYTELSTIPKQIDQFYHLLGKLSERCAPVFLFDNIESFQIFDREQGIWKWNIADRVDVFELIKIIDQQTPFPLIITGRYPIQEFPDLEICNMNTVPFGDFLKKCLTLHIKDIGKQLRTSDFENTLKREGQERPPSFEEIIKILHTTFGGNYRALEFFDELYQQKGAAISKTILKLADFKEQVEEDDIKNGVLAKMSTNLVFDDLLSYLNEEDKDTLWLLAQFNIPVLAMAVGMQRNESDRSGSLEKLVNLTLIEKQVSLEGRSRYYVIPLVKDLIQEKEELIHKFDSKLAGDYHNYIFKEKISQNLLVELAEAFEHYYQAKAIQELNSIGFILNDFYHEIQQFQISLTYGLRTEEVAKENTDSRIWNNLGLIYQLFGELDRALIYFEKSLKDDRKIGNRQGEGGTLNNISQIYGARGDYKRSLEYLEKSLKILQEIGDRKGEGVTLNNLSQIYNARGDYERSLEYLEASLKIRQEIGDRQGEGVTLNNISQIYDANGDYERSLEYLEASLKITQEIGDRKGEGVTLNNIGQIHKVRGDYERSLEYLEESLKIRQEIGDREGESTTLGNIARIYQATGQLKLALEFFQKDLKICQSIGDINGMAITLTNIGVLFFEQNKKEESITYLMKAYSIFKKIGSLNDKIAESYLNAIIEEIGTARFKEIMEEINQ